MKPEFARIKRLPPYVFTIVDEFKQAAAERGEDIIDFGMGNPDQSAPQHVVETLITAAKQPNADRYSSSRGIKPLRQAICDWYANKFSVELDPGSEAIVTIGSKEGLGHLALAMTGPGDSVIVPDPAYPIHVYGFVIAGAQIIKVPLRDSESFF